MLNVGNNEGDLDGSSLGILDGNDDGLLLGLFDIVGDVDGG